MHTADAIRLTLAAFAANPETSDDEVCRLLASVGIPAVLARSLVVLTPLAFGRALLHGIGAEFAATFVRDDGRGNYVDEAELIDYPYFAEALDFARNEVGRGELETVALRSAEVQAINAALNAGQKPENLVLAPPAIAWNLEGPSASDETLKRTEPNVLAWTQDRLARYAVPTRAFGEHVVIGDGVTLAASLLPRMIQSGRVRMQLDVIARRPEFAARRALVESFAADAPTIAEAAKAAFDRFAEASLDVIIASFVGDRFGNDRLRWETWTGRRAWRVCVGSLLQSHAQVASHPYGTFLEQLKAQLSSADLSPEPHWVRTFYAAQRGNAVAAEVLFDNEPWEKAERALRGLDWPATAQMFSLRQLLVMLPFVT
ncbi:MAG TPA: DUF6348 family protein [Polyangiaceae bacterium]|nr:DUF6348 family protein [Polyangiaceae bacterium]